MPTPIGIMADSYAAIDFDPLVIPWTRAYWSSGPEFTALGLADGATVTTWPDEIGSDNLTSLSGTSPVYRATSLLNNKPGVEYSGLANLGKTGLATIAQPYSQVAIAYIGDVNWGNAILIFGASNIGMLLSGHVGAIDTFRINGGVSMNGALWSATGSYFLAARYNGASSLAYQNGTETSGDAGTSARSPTLGVGSNNSGGSNWGGASAAPVAFVGVYAGDIFAHSEWPNLVAWARTFYGANIP